jgi:hypothetical protein
MKKKNLLFLIIATVFLIIGSILLYKKGEINSAVIVTGVMILIGFMTQIRKLKKNKD